MSWPLSQDYNEAIQSPQTSFADAELRGGEAVTNALGMPMPRSGNFADVYEFTGASGDKWAVKCFTREVRGLHERYSEISKQLIEAKLPFTVDFQYLEQGVRIRGRWYPILKMQWVEGFLLNEFVRNNLDKPVLLEALGQIWVRMGRRLRKAGIAHADLQHGNVILVPGSKTTSLAVKLIDYDGMFVPALADKKSGEVGHPAYQHPQRIQQQIYSADVDRLPLLGIACALRCLVVGGKALWERHDNGDNLLFREADLRAPGKSKLFKELHELSDPQARMLVTELEKGLGRDLQDVPALDELLPETPKTSVRGPANRVTAIRQGGPPATSTSPWDFDETAAAEAKSKAKDQRKGIPTLALVGGALLVLCVLAGGAFWVMRGGSKEDGLIAQKKLGDNMVRPEFKDRNKKEDENQEADIRQDDKKPVIAPPDDPRPKQPPDMPLTKDVEAVLAKLKENNPGWEGKQTRAVKDMLSLRGPNLLDIAPVRALTGLRNLDLYMTQVSDLSPLKDMSLTRLTCFGTQVSTLAPIKDMKLSYLNCGQTPVSDLSPLKDMPLTNLMCQRTKVSDLSPLRETMLNFLDCSHTPIADLSPLKDLKLSFLNCSGTQVTDLAPLKGMSLSTLICQNIKLADLSTLRQMKLSHLDCSGTQVADLSPLKDMNLYYLNCSGTPVTDLAPLKGMQLQSLTCQNTKIADLSPLKDMKLISLDCSGTAVSDLSPLKDMPLSSLNCQNAKVTDLSPLKGMPLKHLQCDVDTQRDAVVLRSMKTLQSVNGKGVAQFLQEAGEKPVPADASFTALFNGKDLDGWKTHIKVPGDWRVANGVLTGSAADGGSLFTTRNDYKDFQLRVEARINDGGVGGVFCRTPFAIRTGPNQSTSPIGISAVINSTSDRAVKTGGLQGGGTNIGGNAPLVPAGAWFTLEVLVQDSRWIVNIDGKKILNVTVTPKTGQLPSSGHIALHQEPASVLEFRKIEIKDLPALAQQNVQPIDLPHEGGSIGWNGPLLASDPLYKGQKKHKLFLFHMEAGNTYHIDMKSEAFDSFLSLENPDGVFVAQNDDGGGKLDAKLMIIPGRSGKHRIIASSLDGNVGRFALTIRQAAVGARKPPAVAVTTRLPEPDAEAQERAATILKELYRTEYSSKKTAERAAFATKLLKRGHETTDDAATRFVLWREAGDVAVLANAADLAMSAVEAQVKHYLIKPLALKIATLEKLVERPLSSAEAKAAGKAALAAGEQAVMDEDYEAGEKIAALAKKASAKASDLELSKQIAGLTKDLETAQKQLPTIDNARATLKTSAGDAQANLVVGKYLCAVQDRWDEGLPLLLRSEDAKMKSLAEKVGQGPGLKPTGQLELADLYWDWSLQEPMEFAKARLQRRAQSNYAPLLPRLTGLEKTRAENRLRIVVGKKEYVPGLVADLFNDVKFKTRVTTRLDYRLHFNWGLDSPDNLVNPDQFGIRWSGYIKPPRAGVYTLRIEADNGSKIWVNGQVVYSKLVTNGVCDDSFKVTLTKSLQPLIVEYVDSFGPAHLRLSWTLPDETVEEAIPAEAFYHDRALDKLLSK